MSSPQMAFMSALHIGSFDSSSDSQGSLIYGAERSERAAVKACRSLPAKRLGMSYPAKLASEKFAVL